MDQIDAVCQMIKGDDPLETLPDGTPLEVGVNFSNVIHYWTGKRCADCKGTGQSFNKATDSWTCQSCGGTGEEFGPVYLVEE